MKRKRQGEGDNLIVFDLHPLAHFCEEGPYVQLLSDISTTRVLLFALKSGQQLRELPTSNLSSG